MLFFALLLVAILIQYINYWWLIGPMAFIITLVLGKHSRRTFLSGFIANALVWLVALLVKTHASNPILMNRVSQMFFLPHWSLLMIITAMIGGMVCGAGAFAGHLTYQLTHKEERQ